MSDWMGDTPQTVMTTRAPAVLTNCTRGFEENPWLRVETNINKVPQKWIDYP